MGELRALELCCCAGGMALGFRAAGVEFDTAIDFSSDACDSYERNLGRRPIQIDVRDLLRLGWEPRERIDLLVADPPCTPWSRAGKRQGLADKRDLLRETVDLIRKLRPVAFLIGNVPGLDDGSNRNVVQTVIGSLWRDGYAVDYARLDAADYGVPQHRIRPFWFGRPQASEPIVWPAPSHCDPVELATVGMHGDLKPWVTCRDALSHLPVEELGRPIRIRSKPRNAHPPSVIDEPANTVLASTPRVDKGGAILAMPGGVSERGKPWSNPHPPSELDAPARVITAKTRRAGHGGGGSVLAYGRGDHRPSRPSSPSRTLTRSAMGDGSLLVWPWPRPATTITADPNGRIGPPNHHGHSFLSDPNAVALSERAAAILQGFPDGAVFSGKTKAARWDQIGMAMPPPLAAAVARSIVRWFASQARNTREHGHASMLGKGAAAE